MNSSVKFLSPIVMGGLPLPGWSLAAADPPPLFPPPLPPPPLSSPPQPAIAHAAIISVIRTIRQILPSAPIRVYLLLTDRARRSPRRARSPDPAPGDRASVATRGRDGNRARQLG